MWALNTQLDERWWTSLRDESILYLGYQRNENSALKNAGKPYTKRFLEQKSDGAFVVTDPTLEELKKFIAVTIHRGMHGNPSIKHYFSEDAGDMCPLVKQIGLSRDRYQDLLMVLHCQDDFSATGKEKMKGRGPEECRKIQDLLDIFKDNAQKAFDAGRELSYDEMMIRWNGLLKEKFLKQPKPIAVGLKMMALCDAMTGYLLDFALDKKDGTRKDDVLLRVCERFRGKDHRLYADNAFITVHSLKELLKMRIYATGTTARSSGKGFPADLLKLKEVKKDGVSSFELGNGTVLKSGEYACMEAKVRGPGDAADTEEGTETLFAYTWFDSGLASFLTSVDFPEDTTVPRRAMLSLTSADDGTSPTRVRPEKLCPGAAQLYNKWMAGVDTNDNMRARYFSQKGSKKWWMAVFYWMVDVAFINAYILWCLGNGKDRRKDSHHGGRYDFMMRLVKQLAGIKNDCAAGSGSAAGTPSANSGSRPVKKARSRQTEADMEKVECEAPVPVPYRCHVLYGNHEVGPKCKHCICIDGKKNNDTRAVSVCINCHTPLCTKHWMQFPPHYEYYGTKPIVEGWI